MRFIPAADSPSALLRHTLCHSHGRLAVKTSGRSLELMHLRWPVQVTLSLRCRRRRRRPSASALTTRADMTVGVLEGIAKLALQSQLKRFQAVDVSVEARPSRLLQGEVDGAVVRGIAWESPLGLSARLLEVKVGAAGIDILKTLQSQNIQLSNIPQGSGRVRFTADDFSSLLSHPLMKTASLTAVEGMRFAFDPSSVSLAAGGSLKFSGVWEKDGKYYRSELEPGNGRQVIVKCSVDGKATEIAAATRTVESHLATFFSRLTLELDGVFFTFSNIKLAVAAKTGLPIIDLELDVRVERFPSLSQLKF